MYSVRHDHNDHLSADRFNLSYKYQHKNIPTSSRDKDDNPHNTRYTAEKRRVFKRPQSSLDHVITPPPPPPPPLSSNETHKSSTTRKTPSRSPSPPQSFSHRKSAIKDVLKQFQCNNDRSRMNTTVMCQPMRSSPRSSPSRRRSSTSNQDQNRDILQKEMLDNSLLDESVMDSIPYSLHYSKERSHKTKSQRSVESSPLQKLFQRPLQTCRGQFIYEPETTNVKASPGCNLFSNKNYVDDVDDNFLGFPSNFSKEELDTVFRRPISVDDNEEVQTTNQFSLNENSVTEEPIDEIDFTQSYRAKENNLKSNRDSEHNRLFITPSVHKDSLKSIDPMSANTALTEVSTPDSENPALSVGISKTPEQLFREELSPTDIRLERALFELDAKNKILEQISKEKDEMERKMHEMEQSYIQSQQDREDAEASFLLDSFISEEETENQIKELTKLRKVNHQVRLEINQEKKKKEELQNQVRALQLELFQRKNQMNDLNQPHTNQSTFDTNSPNFLHSVNTTKDTLSMKVDIVSLKSKLANAENLLKLEKEAREKDRNQFKKDETRLQTQIQKLMKSLAKGKTAAQYSALEAQLHIQKEDIDLLQERLTESEIYISTLEKTMDDQLKAWEEEEEDFKKESSILREKAARAAVAEEALSRVTDQCKTLEQELLASKREVARLSSETRKLDESGIQESSKESVEHLLELANELRIENDALRAEVKLVNKSLEDTQISVENQYKSEISRLKEELKHATFRVQVMKNSSSPKRNNQINSRDFVLNDNSNYNPAQSNFQGGSQIESQIVEKVPTEQLIQLKEAKDAALKEISRLQNELNQLKSVNNSLLEEAAARKRIDLALRDEIASLRQAKIESSSNSILPSVPKTHSNLIDGELQKLENSVSSLHEYVDVIAKAQAKKNRNVPLLEKIFNLVTELKTTFTLVYAASEEDKARVENALQIYDSAVQSYELQLIELKKKLEKTKQDLNEQQAQRSDDLKRSKQSEMDNLAKFSMLKQKFSNLEKEYDLLKARTKIDTNDARIPDETSKKSSAKQNTNWKMKIQHTTSEEEVEMKLNERDSISYSFSDIEFSTEHESTSSDKSQIEKDLVIETRILDMTESQSSKLIEGDMKKRYDSSASSSMENTSSKVNSSDEYSELYVLNRDIQSATLKSFQNLDSDSFVLDDGNMTQASF